MQTSVESVGTNSDETVVMVLVTGPVRTEKLVRFNKDMKIVSISPCFFRFSLVNVEKSKFTKMILSRRMMMPVCFLLIT